MNARNRAARCEARPDLHDALLPREREVLAMWDAGASHAAIVSATGQSAKRVKDTVIAYDDRLDSDPDEAVRRGSAALLERILQFHPHVALGRPR